MLHPQIQRPIDHFWPQKWACSRPIILTPFDDDGYYTADQKLFFEKY